MKRFLFLLLASLLVTIYPSSAEDANIKINFTNNPVPQLLASYKQMSGLELVVDSRVKAMHSTVTVRSSSPLTNTETLKLIEEALLHQARVVITRLDDKRASVTLNDALPVTD